MTSLYLIGIILAVVAVAVWLAMRTGRQAAEKKAVEINAKVKDELIKAALDKPDKPKLVDRLRDGKF